MSPARRPTLVIAGSGMAGARLVEEILNRAPDRFQIRLFGEEPNGTYNRILLSSVLGGFADPAQLWTNPLSWYEKRGVFVHGGVRVDQIDRTKKIASGAGGKVIEPYDYLVLATGSRPYVPPLAGTHLSGVFVFRTLDDCSAIAAYAQECDRAVVIGGGLLGLEAARGLLAHEVEVTVVETAAHLMPQQLDAMGGDLLKRKMEAMGIEVLVRQNVLELTGTGRVSGVRLADGRILETDLVIISCGIRPNVSLAKEADLLVDRGIVVDDQMRTSDPQIFAVGECAQHKGTCYGLVEPVYEQAKVLATVLTGEKANYRGSRLATTLKVMGVELTAMGDVHGGGPDVEVVSHLEPDLGMYKKLVVREGRLAGAILLGTPDHGGMLKRLFKNAEPIPDTPLALLAGGARTALLAGGNGDGAISSLAEETQICNCNEVCKGTIVAAIKAGCNSVAALGERTKAGTGCGTCQPLLQQLLTSNGGKPKLESNKIEEMKKAKDGLDALPDLLRLAENNNWQEMSEDDKQRSKWYGLFFRKQTPGHFMLRLRMNAGRADARQLRVIADLSDEFGKGFCDLTTRQQIQLRWFTLAQVPEIWQRLADVGLHSKQTGLDNVRGVCGCPVAGVTPHELLDATRVVEEFNDMLVDSKEFTNLPRKFNVTITGCLENCTHVETQDIGLVPAFRELDGRQVNGFNVLVGGKQGSGGYKPAQALNVFARAEEAAEVCKHLTFIFRDHGHRGQRTRARLAFLIEEKGLPWLRAELARRIGRPLTHAGKDMRKTHHVDHLGIHPQKSTPGSPARFSLGLLVPVGRITTAQLRGVADLAERYGTGEVRLTVQQNIVIPDIPDERIGALTEEPLMRELPHDPSPIMRGLVCCTGNDYCHMALIETKGWALKVAQELERRTEGKKIAPLTTHWSGCSAGCGLHQVATIGLQACRSRVNGTIVDAAHVCVKGQAGPQPIVAQDLMYDVPCEQLADALLPLVMHLPRK